MRSLWRCCIAYTALWCIQGQLLVFLCLFVLGKLPKGIEHVHANLKSVGILPIMYQSLVDRLETTLLRERAERLHRRALLVSNH